MFLYKQLRFFNKHSFKLKGYEDRYDVDCNGVGLMIVVREGLAYWKLYLGPEMEQIALFFLII